MVALWEVLHFAARLHLLQPAVWRVRPRQVLYPLQVRLRGSSDLDAFDQIFNFQEYLCLQELEEPNLILDLGANVGFSSAYFLSVFPKARVGASRTFAWRSQFRRFLNRRRATHYKLTERV